MVKIQSNYFLWILEEKEALDSMWGHPVPKEVGSHSWTPEHVQGRYFSLNIAGIELTQSKLSEQILRSQTQTDFMKPRQITDMSWISVRLEVHGHWPKQYR